MMIGLPGSGKTFFAEQFSEMFGAPYIDANFVEQHCADQQSSDELCRHFLNEIVRTKQTFIYEGAGLTRASRTEFARWARGNGYQPLFVWVQTDETTCRRRAQKTRSIDAEQFASIARSFTEPNHTERTIVISGKHTFKTQARAILSRLGDANRNNQAIQPQPRPSIQRRGISIQ